MSFLIYIPVFFTSYVFYSVFAGLTREKGLSRIENLLFALFCAPIALALLLYHLFFFFPCRSDAFYVTIISAVLLLAGLLCLPARRDYFRAVSGAGRAAWGVVKNHPVRCAILLLALALIAVKAIVWPFVSDDATCYALLGRYFYHVKHVLNYPMRFPGPDGLIIAQKHPPGQILFYTLSAMFAGTDADDFAWRSVSFYYLVILVLMVWVVARRVTGRAESGWVGVLILLGTPVITWMTIFNTMDPARLAGMLAAVYTFHRFTLRPSLKMALVTAIIIATAISIHLAGCLLLLLLLGYACADWVLRRIPWPWLKEKIPGNPAPVILTLLILLLSIIPLTAYIHRLLVPVKEIETRLSALCPQTSPAMGYPAGKIMEQTDIVNFASHFVGDPNPQWLMIKNLNGFSRMRKVLTRVQYNSFAPGLRPFTNLVFFSVTFWLWLAAVIVLAASRRRLTPAEYFFLLTSVMGVFAVLTCRYGNPRYVATFLPLVCVVAACAFTSGNIQQRFAARKRIWRGIIAAYALLAGLTPFAVAGMQKGDLRHILRNDTQKRLWLTNDFRGAPDYFRTLEYIRGNISRDDYILVFRHAAFFYYTRNKGITFKYDPKTRGLRLLLYQNDNMDIQNAWRELNACGCKYILTDPAFTQQWETSRNSVLPELYKSELMRLVYQSGEVCLYEVLPDLHASDGTGQ